MKRVLEMAVYGYVRVSSEHQSKSGISLNEQRRMIAAYAELRGLGDVLEFFVDAAVSGGVALHKRENGARLLDTIQRGDIVIITKLDRAFRKAADCLNTVELLKKKSVSLHIIDLNGDVTGNGISALFLTIMAAVAEFERNIISERQKDTKRNMKNEGRYLGGKTRFGTRILETTSDNRKTVKVLEVDKDKQEVIDYIRNNMSISNRKLEHHILKEFGVKINFVTVYRIKNDLKKHQSSGVKTKTL